MPLLTVSRDSGYADAIRNYKLVLDGIEIGEVAPGGSTSFEIDPGEHTIQAKIDWCSTQRISFTTEENDVAFEAFSKLRGLRILGSLFAIIIPGAYIGIREIDPGSLKSTPTKYGVE